MSSITNEMQTMMRALDGLSLRHRTTAINLANQSVPGYKRRVVEFEAQLDKARRTGEFRPKVTIDNSPGSVDGNNVDAATEVGALTRIDLAYKTIAQVIAKKAGRMRTAISGR